MSIASEAIVTAEGWQEFDVVDQDKGNQDHLNFAHDVAKTFGTSEGKRVLDAMVKKYMMVDIVQSNDSQMGVGIKQGRASVVKQILAQIEISANS